MTTSVIRGSVRVDWDELGEGWNGDYNPDDPDDTELLRFTVYWFDGQEWVECDDTSYCTRVPAGTSDDVRQRLLEGLMDEFASAVTGVHGTKKLGERLSWIDPTWYQSNQPKEQS